MSNGPTVTLAEAADFLEAAAAPSATTEEPTP